MPITENQIETIVERVVEKLGAVSGQQLAVSTPLPPSAPTRDEGRLPAGALAKAGGTKDEVPHLGLFPDIESVINAAEKAFTEYQDVQLRTREEIIKSIRDDLLAETNYISKFAVEETKLGRVEDKIKKNILAIKKTPGIEDLFPRSYTGDYGLTLEERAPFGLIAAITPCTNPSTTIICNGIGMIAAGNCVIFNPHPTAKKTAALTVHIMNRAIMRAGGPPNLITMIVNPTIETAQALMKHPRVRLLVVTGGPAVVKAAMNSGKRVVAAGPGNPPVVVDETADIERAGRDVVLGASFDNNVVCVLEKEIIVVESIADELKEAMVANGAVELNRLQAQRLEKIIVDGDHPHKDWVGKDVQLILKQIGLDVDPSKRLAFTETTKDHPFARIEMLLPVIPLIRAKDVNEAIEIAYELENGCFHTAVMHSKNIENLHNMARRMNTTIFVKNAPSYAGLGFGGEGPASLTIASPTGEGLTTARHFTRTRRCTLSGYFRIT